MYTDGAAAVKNYTLRHRNHSTHYRQLLECVSRLSNCKFSIRVDVLFDGGRQEGHVSTVLGSNIAMWFQKNLLRIRFTS